MRTPSIVRGGEDQTVYLVADDLGRIGQIWPEANLEHTDLETVVMDLLHGQYKNPLRVVAFNTAERWSEDVSEVVAHDCASAAICSSGISRFSCRNLSTVTKAAFGTFSCRCRYAWSETNAAASAFSQCAGRPAPAPAPERQPLT